MRTTKQELLNAFSALCAACGKAQGYGIGEWHLSAQSPGDGITRYSIEETVNEGGGVTRPLDWLAFLGRGEAARVMWFAARAVRLATGEKY